MTAAASVVTLGGVALGHSSPQSASPGTDYGPAPAYRLIDQNRRLADVAAVLAGHSPRHLR